MKKATHKLLLRREIVRDLRVLDNYTTSRIHGGAEALQGQPQTGRACTEVALAVSGTCG